MGDIAGALVKMNDIEIAQDAPVTESLHTKIGANINALIDQGIGIVSMFGGTSVPTGFLACDGSSVLRATYADLFAVIGTAWGAADGSHFNVPDMRGVFPRGWDNGAGRDPDAAGRTAIHTGGATGDNVGSYEADGLGSHTHPITVENNAGTPTSKVQAANNGVGSSFTAATGAGGGNETRPKNVNYLFIIKY